jgi:hypothetical protein
MLPKGCRGFLYPADRQNIFETRMERSAIRDSLSAWRRARASSLSPHSRNLLATPGLRPSKYFVARAAWRSSAGQEFKATSLAVRKDSGRSSR